MSTSTAPLTTGSWVGWAEAVTEPGARTSPDSSGRERRALMRHDRSHLATSQQLTEDSGSEHPQPVSSGTVGLGERLS